MRDRLHPPCLRASDVRWRGVASMDRSSRFTRPTPFSPVRSVLNAFARMRVR